MFTVSYLDIDSPSYNSNLVRQSELVERWGQLTVHIRIEWCSNSLLIATRWSDRLAFTCIVESLLFSFTGVKACEGDLGGADCSRRAEFWLIPRSKLRS